MEHMGAEPWLDDSTEAWLNTYDAKPWPTACLHGSFAQSPTDAKPQVVRIVEDTLSQARTSSSLDQLNAVSAFKLGQSEHSIGPTFYPNRTTERSVAARRRRPIRQSSSDGQSRHTSAHADTHAGTRPIWEISTRSVDHRKHRQSTF
jgi:hypothetical protein